MISPGTILIGEDTARPPCFHLEHDPYPDAWMPVKHDLTAYELEEQLGAAGWTFLCMSNAITAMAFCFDRAKMVHTALRRLVAKVKSQKCLEIDEVETYAFLHIPYVSLSAHARHIQSGLTVSGQ